MREFSHLNDSEFDEFLLKQDFCTPNWREDDKKIELIENAVSLSCDVLIQDYQYSIKNRDFVHRNWFREQDTLNRLKDSVINSNHTTLKNFYKSFKN